MGQLSAKLRGGDGFYSHWCPACGEMHGIDRRWTFDGNLERPTFAPSIRISGMQSVVDNRGEWTGEFKRDAAGNVLPLCCHYFIQGGNLVFCTDCTHPLSGRTVPLPDLPWFARDP